MSLYSGKIMSFIIDHLLLQYSLLDYCAIPIEL